MIIALEGIDASGKATQCKKLCAWAKEDSRLDQYNNVVSQDFPDYDNFTGGVIRQVLEKGLELTPIAKATVLQSLMTVNRLEHRNLLTAFSRRTDNLLVLDRYYASGLVYGASDGLDPEWLCHIHESLPTADLWILVDIPVEESFRRRPERRDLYEKDKGKLEEVRQRYIATFATMNNRERDRWIIIDGRGSEDDVHYRIVTVVNMFLEKSMNYSELGHYS